MKEYVVRRFFEGEYGAADLDADFPGTITRHGEPNGPIVQHMHFEPMNVEFRVRASHIVRLIDTVLAGQLQSDIMQAICEWLDAGASGHFHWDADTPEGERIAESVFWLGTPEINYPLTQDVLSKVRHFLLTGEKRLTQADTKAREAGA